MQVSQAPSHYQDAQKDDTTLLQPQIYSAPPYIWIGMRMEHPGPSDWQVNWNGPYVVAVSTTP